MSRFIALLVACVLAVMLAAAGVEAQQGRYYFSRNVMPSVVRYQPVQQTYPARQNTAYVAQQQQQQQYNPYAANWARPVVSVPQQPTIRQQYRPINYYGYNSGENNSGESREVYRRYW